MKYNTVQDNFKQNKVKQTFSAMAPKQLPEL